MATVIRPEDAVTKALPGRRATELVGAGHGAASSTLRIVEIDPDVPGRPPRGPHVHHGFEECIHILAGTGVTRCDSGEYPVQPGDTVLMPAEERHATYNTGKDVLRLMCFFPVNDITPGTVEFSTWDEREAPSR